MNGRALLLQVGIGAPFAALLEVSRARHTAYCERHGYDFWAWTEPAVPVPPMWQRYFGILRALDAGYEFVVHLDADCLIADLGRDMRQASAAPLGMRWGKAPGPEPATFNAGVMFVRPAARALFVEMVGRAPGPDATQKGPWWLLPEGEQRIMTELLARAPWCELVQPVDVAWNCVQGIDEVARPHIVAWHGVPDVDDRIMGMRNWLATHEDA